MVDVEGQFGNVHGKVEIDRFRNSAVVDARIDANAVYMRRQGAENWVKSEEFFNVAKYPEVHFVSSAFPLATLVTGGQLPGILTLRGIPNPIVFTLLPSECARPGFDCSLKAIGSIKRSSFDMRSRKGTLSDRVELRLNIRAHESDTSSVQP
jgi:polyisoprenoid-binding protein YceI